MENIEIKIVGDLTLKMMAQITHDAAALVLVDMGDGHLDYCPAWVDFAFEYSLIKNLTDASLPDDDIEYAYNCMCKNDYVARIVEHFGKEKINYLYKSTKELIEYNKSKLTGLGRFDKVIGGIEKIIDNIQNLTDDMTPEQLMHITDNYKAQEEKEYSMVADTTYKE